MISGQMIELKAETFAAHSYLKACADRIPKAIQNGIYKESFRVAKVAKEGLKAGAPGGKTLAPQSPWTKLKVKRTRRTMNVKGQSASWKQGAFKKSGNRSILSRFGPAIRYKVRRAGAKTSSAIGFVDGRLDRWAAKHAAGYRIPQTKVGSQIMAGVLRAAGIPKAAGKGRAMKVPARPIIGPVWEAEKTNIYNNIRDRVLNAASIGGRY